MVVGEEYYVSFRTVTGGPQPALVNVYSNGIGVKFSTVSTWDNPPELINNEAHFVIEEILTDTVNWELHEFVFTADSAYEYIHLGNFRRDWLTDTIHLNPAIINRLAYYYIDDVRVSTDPLSANREDLLSNRVFPNPATNKLNIKANGLVTAYRIYEASGIEILSSDLKKPRSEFSINLDLASGLYILVLEGNGRIWREKFLIE